MRHGLPRPTHRRGRHGIVARRRRPAFGRPGNQAESVYSGSTGAHYRSYDGKLVPGLDLGFMHATRSRVGGVELTNGGEDLVTITARLGTRILNSLYAERAVRPHPYERVNGTQFCEAVGGSLQLVYVSPPLLGERHTE